MSHLRGSRTQGPAILTMCYARLTSSQVNRSHRADKDIECPRMSGNVPQCRIFWSPKLNPPGLLGFTMKIAYSHNNGRGTIVMPMKGRYEKTPYCPSPGVFKERCVLYY